MSAARLTRRAAMGQAAALAALAPFGRGDGGAAEQLGKVSRRLSCPPALREACRRALPVTEQDPTRIAALLLADLAPAGLSAQALLAAIRARSRADFRSGRFVSVDGWLLSLTETRVCALVR